MGRVTLRIVGAGLQTTVQDLGRPRGQRQGVPGGGAMDVTALRVGNLLVGNDDGSAALEMTLIGASMVFDTATLIAITGGDLEASVDGQSVPLWRAVRVPGGAVVKFGRARVGCRAYLAVAGGIDVTEVFGSRSTYLRGGFGGCDGRALRTGDELPIGAESSTSTAIMSSLNGDDNRLRIATWSAGHTLRSRFSPEPVVRLIVGEHTDLLAAASRTKLFTATFKVSSSSDRMGYRLEGVTLPLREPVELFSEGVTFGTVQLPPDGMPIVLMADRQTTGGYPRIGEVASVDLPIVAQLKPGDTLRFRPVLVGDAQREYLALEYDMAQARMAIALRFPRGKS